MQGGLESMHHSAASDDAAAKKLCAEALGPAPKQHPEARRVAVPHLEPAHLDKCLRVPHRRLAKDLSDARDHRLHIHCLADQSIRERSEPKVLPFAGGLSALSLRRPRLRTATPLRLQARGGTVHRELRARGRRERRRGHRKRQRRAPAARTGTLPARGSFRRDRCDWRSRRIRCSGRGTRNCCLDREAALPLQEAAAREGMPSAARLHLEDLGARRCRGWRRRSDRSPPLGAQRQPRRPAAPPQGSREALPRLVQQHPVLAVARAFHPEAHRIPSSAVVSRAEGDIIDAHLMRCCEKNHALLVRAEVYVQPLAAPHKKPLDALAGRRLAKRVGRDETVETQHGALASQAQLRDLRAHDPRGARGQHREPQSPHVHGRHRDAANADGGGRRGCGRRGHIQGLLGGHGDHA
mmetsp:Transcript_2641/g.6465  ORF Transcript_2641/g.6465 Transcript_2641/m.6465 type:complete len:410 (+) Transcript_2641:81-1310(+)